MLQFLESFVQQQNPHNNKWNKVGVGGTLLCNVQFQKIAILPPQKGLDFLGGAGGSLRPKNLKKCTKLNWKFQGGGGGVLAKIPSVGKVWIFSILSPTYGYHGNWSEKPMAYLLLQQSQLS